VHNQLGRFLLARGRHAEAQAAFRRITELAPDNVQGWNNLGSAAFAQDQLDEARRSWEMSLAIAPNATAASNLGYLAFFQGRYADAVPAFREALKTRDKDHRLWANLAAALYWAPGQREQAAAAYAQALELAEGERRVTPRDGRLLSRMAILQAMLGRATEARGLIAQALELAPQDARVMFAAGEVYEKLGDRARALRFVSAALEAGYSPREVASAPQFAQLRADPSFKAPPPPAGAKRP
jgi:serine/threonine-protein kinase